MDDTIRIQIEMIFEKLGCSTAELEYRLYLARKAHATHCQEKDGHAH